MTQTELKATETQTEKRCFFDLPDAAADFDYWSRAAYWTTEEACALCLGKDPRKVNKQTLQEYYTHDFAKKFNTLYDLIQRANSSDELSQDLRQLQLRQVPPTVFIEWAQHKEIPFPKEVIELVIRRSKQPNWQEKCQKLETALKEHESIISSQRVHIEQLQKQLAGGKYIDCYLSPFMQLMVKCIEANKIDENRHLKKAELVSWIKDNAPEGIRPLLSDHLAETMVTLIRHPLAGRGGNTKSKAKK